MRRKHMMDRRSMLGLMLVAIPAVACSAPSRATALNVYKSPSCGCCGAWVEHVKRTGFKVVVHETDDVSPLAKSLGVPDQLRSCHTAVADGYFIEGHVPASDIRKLLRERPSARGITVPGMPIGSPGMDQSDQREPFSTLLVGRDGSVKTFETHNRPGAR
jgi:hypothetical protein